MTLTPGTRLGVYEIIAKIGEGGMGEVYRATDTKLKRQVAIKVLPASVAGDAERLARFQREAEVLASLNHPNVAVIYGLEDADGVKALVMELVEGPTLADRIAQGAIPLGEALPIAQQIAEALEAAHEQGIIHRDLKPANIKVRPDGTVKVLDFGLAKAIGPPEGGPYVRGDGVGGDGVRGGVRRGDLPPSPWLRRTAEGLPEAGQVALSQAPTITSPAHLRQGYGEAGMTGAGMILGTAAYMSPEQARGKVVDRRADIWAFGCVLYEMLTGRQVFGGETVTDALAAIVERQPDWSHLPPVAAERVGRLLRRCLEKDPRERLHDIADVRIDIQEARSGSGIQPPITGRSKDPSRVAKPLWFAAGVAVAAALGFLWVRYAAAPEQPPISVRSALPVSAGSALSLGRGSTVAFAPDGKALVYVATVKGASDDTTQLFLRALDRWESTPVAGTQGATNPFFSPDGRWIGFFAERKLKKVSIDGGAPVTLADAPSARGESWGVDDTIVFAPSGSRPLVRVSASGGTPTPITTLADGELSHRWPQILPDGRSVLFTIWNDAGWEPSRIAVQSLDGGEARVIVSGGGFGRYVPDPVSGGGYLVYARAEGLMAVKFDLARLEVVGQTVPVLDGVITNLSGGAHFSVSSTGWLAYVPGGLGEADRDLVWVDRAGVEQPAVRVRGMSRPFRLSPDGTRVVRNNTVGTSRNVWIDDVRQGASRQLTVNGNNAQIALWSPDGQWSVFAQGLPVLNLFRVPTDGRGAEERLTTSTSAQVPRSWSHDGRLLALTEFDQQTGADIWLLDVPATLAARDSGREPGPGVKRPFLRTRFTEDRAAFSPDGRWLAYQSNETGQFEVYVQGVEDGGRAVQVSTGGGFEARWSPQGRELFYRSGDRLMAAEVQGGATFAAGPPHSLFSGRYEDDFDMAPDGGRFLMMRLIPDEASATSVVLVSNWLAELRQRVR